MLVNFDSGRASHPLKGRRWLVGVAGAVSGGMLWLAGGGFAQVPSSAKRRFGRR